MRRGEGDLGLGEGEGEAEADEMERHRDDRRLLEPRERLESMLKDCCCAGAGSGLSVWISDQSDWSRVMATQREADGPLRSPRLA